MNTGFPPSTSGGEAVKATVVEEPVGAMLRRVLLAWERLHVLHDGAMLLIVLGFAVFNFQMLLSLEFWLLGIHAAIIANVCY
jgi:hypothetical protein